MTESLKAAFDRAMTAFGPFAAKPQLAVGVSGGADSMALVLLAQLWAAERGGGVLALIVDHGLRRGSDAEAKLTGQRLEARGIATRVLTLTGLGAARLQEAARRARHAALSRATREAGMLFLLLGHHAADQSETVAMRATRGSGGLEGMAGWAARQDVVLLRPLLTVPPAELRAFLGVASMDWVEDPSNHDQRFERVRVRVAGTNASPENPSARRQAETSTARFLARHVILRPEGFAIILADAVPPAVLACLLRVLGGAEYAPNQKAVAALATKLRAATLGGVRLLRAGRLAAGWLLSREPAACAAPVPARHGTIWDGRRRLAEDFEGAFCSAVSADASIFRNISNLPAAVLRGMACIRTPGKTSDNPRLAKTFFIPPAPAASLPFVAPEVDSRW